MFSRLLRTSHRILCRVLGFYTLYFEYSSPNPRRKPHSHLYKSVKNLLAASHPRFARLWGTNDGALGVLGSRQKDTTRTRQVDTPNE